MEEKDLTLAGLDIIPAGSTGILCGLDPTVREHYENRDAIWRAIRELDSRGQRETALLYAPGRAPWKERDPYPDWTLTVVDGEPVIEAA